MDKSEQEYKTYSEQMPWWCLPYALSTLPTLTTIFQAHGMPHLVVIDTDGKVITKNGVESLGQDPVGKNFPWRPTRIIDLLPEYYIVEDNDDEAMVPISDLDDKYILLYFASKSDSLSQDFTPWLVKAYNILRKKRPDDFEVGTKQLQVFCVVVMCYLKNVHTSISFVGLFALCFVCL